MKRDLRGTMMQVGLQMLEIQVKEPIDPDFFFRNQAAYVSGY